jgi:RimJ/RimL family protein N-acetyltransferase
VIWRVTPYAAGDSRALAGPGGHPEAFHDAFDAAADHGAAWTFWRADTPLACGGWWLLQSDAHAAQAWLVFSDLATAQDKRALAREARRLVHTAGVARLEATARCDQPAHRRFLEWLGFDREGRLRAYDPADRCDHWILARIKGA